VYYTSPPEKREEAVEELLRELQAPPETDTEKPLAGTASRATISSAEIQNDQFICPACLHKNSARQRFCGLCGFPLRAENENIEEAVPTIAPKPVDRKEDDWQWLRERNLQQLSRSRSTLPRIAIVLAVLAFVAGASVLWFSRSQSRSANAVSARPSAPATKPERIPETTSSSTSPGATAGQSTPASSSSNNSELQPVAPGASQSSASPDKLTDEGGEELIQGRRYLEGQGVPKNSAVAASLLWKSVSKQNVGAILLLSDLYVRGDGVPQSCDQARVLLRAAAQRGSSEARDKLNTISRICP
jgi:hypothetical protein